MTIDEIHAEMCNHFCWNAPYASDDNLFCKTCPMNGLPRWIPCSERMPEDRVNVLVCRTNGDEFIAHHIETGFVTILEPFLLEDDTVAAWMPLPKPPEYCNN